MNTVASPREKAILVVDDEKNIRFTIVHALKSDHYEVDSASSGAEGLQRCRAKHYDLLLVDLRMPGMDGLEMLSELRRATPDAPPAVIITAHGVARELFAAAALGAIDSMRKPFSIHSVRSMVHEVLGRFDDENNRSESRAEKLRRQGKLYLMQRHCREASAILEAAARLDPVSSDTFFLLALCDLLENRRKEAIAHLRYAVYVDPNNKVAAEYLAWLAQEEDDELSVH
jgi:DNA-binding response OmpR family regulator